MIFIKTWGDINIASSRLRAFYIAPFLNDQVSFEMPERFKYNDILIIQKVPDWQLSRKAQSEGARVIYDIDDNYFDKPEYCQTAEEANLVTVGAPYLTRYVPEAAFVDDCIDWDGKTLKTEHNPEGKLIGWTGYGNNTRYLNDIYDTLTEQGYKFRLITSPDYKDYFKGEAEFKQWSLETVDKDLAECDLCVYHLPQGEFEQAKGMNKLLKAWAIGLPTYVSPMPEYERAMYEAYVGGFVKTDWTNLKLDLSAIEKCRNYAIGRYHPARIAYKWQRILNFL
jgi:hypothetical protein